MNKKVTLTDISLGMPLADLAELHYGSAELEPHYAADELNYSAAELNYSGAELVPPDESGFIPELIMIFHKQVWCKRYCRSLGYEKREKLGGDKRAFLKCRSECQVHFKDIKKKKYNIKPAEPEAKADVDKIDKETQKETGTKVSAEDAERMEKAEGGKKMMIYVIIGLVLLAIIIGAVIMMRKKKAA